MSLFSCCGCCENASDEEKQHFVKPANVPKSTKVLGIGEKFLVRNVTIPDIDQQFRDVADLYNEQVEYFGTIACCITELADISHCEPSLTTCISTLKEKHDDCEINLHMNGYNFSLLVNTRNVPEDLQQAQEILQNLNRATKIINKNQTRLVEMMNSVLWNKTQMADRVKGLNLGHLDQVRLENNLEANVQSVDKAKELSKEYEEEANKIFREIASIAGIKL